VGIAFTATKGNSMTNRTSGTAAKTVSAPARQPITWTSVTKMARGVVTTAQHTLTVFGLSAVAVVGVLYTNPDMAHSLSNMLAPKAPAAAPVAAPPLTALMDKPAVAPTAAVQEDAPLSADERKMLGNQKQQKYVTEWLAKRYRVANDATNMLVSTAYLTAREYKIDPLLILAVMAIESGFNPFAESPMGAQGLMQVMSKVHRDKFEEMGGTQAALNPVANIRVGAQILKEYVARGGSVEAGLKTYVGAAAFETDSGYGSKVLAEWKRLKLVASGKKVPTHTRPAAPATVIAAKATPAEPLVAKAEAEPAVAAAEQIAGL
jgi:hypothetical protein